MSQEDTIYELQGLLLDVFEMTERAWPPLPEQHLEIIKMAVINIEQKIAEAVDFRLRGAASARLLN